MRKIVLVLLAGAAFANPAYAQIGGIMQSLQNLKATANQLARGSNSTKNNVQGTTAAATQGVSADAQAGDIVNSSFATDDALDTQLASSPTVPLNPASFSVVGLKLGMSVKEARRVAVQQHFHAGGWEMGQSFETQARFAAANGMAHPLPSTGAVLAGASPHTADGGSLGVRFEATSDGARIKSIYYKGFLKGQSIDRVLGEMESRFGKPTDVSGTGLPFKNVRWGGRLADSPKGASLSVNFDSGNGTFDMTLDAGLDEYISHGKQVDARAAQIRSQAGGRVTF